METYKELKDFCDKKIKEYPSLKEKYDLEISNAFLFYKNGRNLYDELQKAKQLSFNFVIPFLLGFTTEVTKGERNFIQVRSGSSGGKHVPLVIVI